MDDLTTMTAAELAAAVAAGSVSAAEVTQAHLDRIAAVDGDVRAFLHVNGEDALAQARAVDRKRAAGEPLGALAGVPVAVKDLFTTIGAPATCGSKILEGWYPPYESTVTGRLREAGAVLIGKTNMDEFAMGSSTENSGYGPSHNPWDLARVPGGSSGGSAAAVAAYEAPLALGTDTGGSIRQPAAVCGIVGAKPTYGGSSRYGVVAFASSLDTPGPFGRTVLDAALLHEAMSGHDPMDSTSIDAPVPPVVAAARHGDVAGLRIGVVTDLSGEGYQPGVMSTVHRGGRGARVARGQGHRAQLPALQVRAARVLPDRAERVLLQPGPVRRHAVRAADRHRQRRGDHGARPARPGSAPRSSGASCSAPTPSRAATTTPTTARRSRSGR